MTDLNEPERICFNCMYLELQGDEEPCIDCGPAKEGWKERPR